MAAVLCGYQSLVDLECCNHARPHVLASPTPTDELLFTHTPTTALLNTSRSKQRTTQDHRAETHSQTS